MTFEPSTALLTKESQEAYRLGGAKDFGVMQMGGAKDFGVMRMGGAKDFGVMRMGGAKDFGVMTPALIPAMAA